MFSNSNPCAISLSLIKALNPLPCYNKLFAKKVNMENKYPAR